MSDKSKLTPKLVMQWSQAVMAALVPCQVIFLYATSRSVTALDIQLMTFLAGGSALSHGVVRFFDAKTQGHDDDPKERDGSGNATQDKTEQAPRVRRSVSSRNHNSMLNWGVT